MQYLPLGSANTQLLVMNILGSKFALLEIQILGLGLKF
jgi:hypothetical protein